MSAGVERHGTEERMLRRRAVFAASAQRSRLSGDASGECTDTDIDTHRHTQTHTDTHTHTGTDTHTHTHADTHTPG